MTDGYSMSGSQAKRVALKPGGTLSGGKRFSVCGPVRGGSAAPRVGTNGPSRRSSSPRSLMACSRPRFAERQPSSALFELLQHLLRDKPLPRVVEVVAVVGEDAVRLVVRVVFLPVLDERLAQVVERHVLRLGHFALDLRE